MNIAAQAIIQKYVNKNAEPDIRSRGLAIYSKPKRIISSKINKEKNDATYIILGDSGNSYEVTIRNYNNENIASFCTCPYKFGNMCKHEVAALLHIKNSLSDGHTFTLSAKQIVLKRNTNTPYYIKNYESLTDNEARNYCSTFGYYGLSVELLSLTTDKGRAEFNVGDYWNPNTVKIHIHPSEGLGFTCSCNKKVARLCEHAAQVLKKIAIESKLSEFLLQLNPEYVEKKKKEILKEFGLKEDALFEEYFKLENSLKGFILTLVKKGIGLQRIKQYRKERETGIISLFHELKKQETVNLPAGAITGTKHENTEAKQIGYALYLGSSDITKGKPRLIPVCGRLNKNGKTFAQIKEIERIDSNGYIKISEDDKTLISLSKIMVEESAYNHINMCGLDYSDGKNRDNEIQKFYLEQLNEIIPLLEKQPHVFACINNNSGVSVRKSDVHEIKVSSIPARLSFRLSEKDDVIVLQTYCRLGEDETKIVPSESAMVSDEPFLFTKINGVYHLNSSVGESCYFSLFKKNPVMKVARSDFDNFFEDVVKPIAQKFPVSIQKISNVKSTSFKLIPKEKRLYISEMGSFILFKPFVMYESPVEGELLVEILNENNIIEKKDGTITTFKRENSFENDFISHIKTLHPRFENQAYADFLHLPMNEMFSDNWFFSAFQKLREAEVVVFGYNELKSFNYSPYKAKVTVQLTSGEDWFDVDVQVAYGDFNVDLKDIQRAVLRNERYIKLADGTTGILPDEWFEKFKKYFQHGEVKEKMVQISKLKFSIIDELFDNIDNMEIVEELAEKKQRMASFKEIRQVKTPDGIKARLRDYQKEGLNWMNFLHEFKWGGILADDMGLGKTLQAIAFLAIVSKKSKKANLIVVPTSLMFNWENEIKKFAPSLKVMFYHGNDRIKDHSSFGKYNMIFTTYGLMARDIELLKKYKFQYIILDESQAIKNPLSQRYKAACLLRGENRIALTGTPIENNTFDLFAQMNFLNPGFLGNAESFKKNYSIPIDRDRDEQSARSLHKLINPFIIRRTKEQVEKDLPEKTEDILYCTMEAPQQKIYDAFRNKYRKYLLGKIEEEGLAKSKIYVLEGLLKLRQICDSPEILSDEEKYSSDSIKIKELLRHINEKTGNHKLLIFSQFVKMLHLIKKELDDCNISYEYLDGQSSIHKRQESVNHFQNDEKCRVFLISLKAGGLGLNLTAADYVYIVDPWWNPAIENQAIDRSHRIGQTKKVIAYRMICKNTVEEKILNLQTKKKQIASDIIQTDESFMKSITRSDIEQLFE